MKKTLFLLSLAVCGGCASIKKPEFELLSLDREKLSSQNPKFKIASKTQPPDFDPATDLWKKYEQSGSPTHLYCETPNCEPPHMNINGWVIEGERKIKLVAPFDLDFYEFGVASSTDYILELKKNSKRQALYRDVYSFFYMPSKGSGKLAMQFIDRSIKILDIESASQIDIPAVRCTELLGTVSNQFLVTHSDKNSAATDKALEQYQTEFCIWDPAGNLQARLNANLTWLAYNEYALYHYGITPASTETFYALNSFGSQQDGKCILVLQHLTNQARSMHFEIPETIDLTTTERDDACLTWELDLNGVTVNSKYVRYRQKGGAWKTAKATK